MVPERNFQIAVLDFGSQYTQLIARKIREQKVYCEILPHDCKASTLEQAGVKGIVLSGGPASVYDTDAPALNPALLEAGIPILGICYGMQQVLHRLGGTVSRIAGSREYGKAEITLENGGGALFHGLQHRQQVWMSHGDSTEALPSGFRVLARTPSALAAVADEKRTLYLVQFHPEVKHTSNGEQILANFLFRIASVDQDWDMGSFVDQTVAELQDRIGNQKVVCAVSGGVDSSVMAVLLHRAIGDNLHCIFVDNGLLRKNERHNVEQRFRRHFAMHIHTVDASRRFLRALKNVSHPEKKRKIIGREFLKVFFREAGNFRFLAQGTLYPDVIESGGHRKGPAATIKTHHNRVERVMKLIEAGRVVEPFQELFKDEVRRIGRLLGMPDEVVLRQPFPGPGLAIRVIGAVSKKRLDLLREADEIVVHEMKQAGLYYKAWQTFVVLLPIHSVGVMGDERTYEHVVAIRSVESTDAMTSHWSPLPYDLLEKMSNRIINEVDGINRVVYDISSKPPATIEWE